MLLASLGFPPSLWEKQETRHLPTARFDVRLCQRQNATQWCVREIIFTAIASPAHLAHLFWQCDLWQFEKNDLLCTRL